MAVSLTILDAVLARLKQHFPDRAVEYFPDVPGSYRLNHVAGALLLQYSGTSYTGPIDTALVVQPGTVTLTCAVVTRQLNGRDGSVATLERVRRALVGFKPPNCRRKCWITAEKFVSGDDGLWIYALDCCTEAVVVEDAEADAGPLLKHITTEDGFNRSETIKHRDGSITHEEFSI